MAYDCWLAPILWSEEIWSLDLPSPGAKMWVTLNITGGIPLKAGKTYRITIHTIGDPPWEWWDGDEWKEEPSYAAIQCWGNTAGGYGGGERYYGCNYGGSSGSWTDGGDLTFRVYATGDVLKDNQETANYNYAAFQLWNAGSQTFTPSEDYTATKIELMLNEFETIRRGYLIVKLERVTMGDPGFKWVEGTKLAYTDNTGVKRTKEGTATGVTGKLAGQCGVKPNDTYYYYIDATGAGRKIEGTKEGATGKVSGQCGINTSYPTKFAYIDGYGDERHIEGTVSA